MKSKSFKQVSMDDLFQEQNAKERGETVVIVNQKQMSDAQKILDAIDNSKYSIEDVDCLWKAQDCDGNTHVVIHFKNDEEIYVNWDVNIQKYEPFSWIEYQTFCTLSEFGVI